MSGRGEADLFVSGVFGRGFDAVYPALPGKTCVFFTNRPDLAPLIEANGWICHVVRPSEVSDDPLTSALQSKWVKFLQFLDDFPEYRDFEAITYFDHKFFVRPKHIDYIYGARKPDADILIRTTPKLKETISVEIEAARPQERYARHMPETEAYLYALRSTGQIGDAVRIVNTGLIHFARPTRARALTDAVYDACMTLRQPECQILWAALSQIAPVSVQSVPWGELEPLWRAPRLQPGADDEAAAEGLLTEGVHGVFEGYEGDLISSQIQDFGAHTRNEIAFVLDHIGPGERCVDIGAHIGTFSIPIASKIGPEGRLLAIEGDDDVFARLDRNVRRNGALRNTVAICAIVGGAEPRALVRRDVAGNTGAGYYEPAAPDLDPTAGLASVDVASILRQYRIDRPDFIKIDVEGMEGAVIRSLMTIVEASKPALYIEVSKTQLARHGESPATIGALLQPLGYRFFRNVGLRNSRTDDYEPVELASLEDVAPLFDVLALPPSRRLADRRA